jgi:hypothetical protein
VRSRQVHTAPSITDFAQEYLFPFQQHHVKPTKLRTPLRASLTLRGVSYTLRKGAVSDEFCTNKLNFRRRPRTEFARSNPKSVVERDWLRSPKNTQSVPTNPPTVRKWDSLRFAKSPNRPVQGNCTNESNARFVPTNPTRHPANHIGTVSQNTLCDNEIGSPNNVVHAFRSPPLPYRLLPP